MLPNFRIQNLRAPDQNGAPRDSIVQISAPGYDETISAHPAATLRYQDEENDTITIGSSSELIDKLQEPVPRLSPQSSHKSTNRISIAMLLSEAQQNPESLKHHTFSIEEREEIQKLWQEIQQRNKDLPPTTPLIKKRTRWTVDDNSLLVQLRKEGKGWEEIAQRMEGHSPNSLQCRYLRYKKIQEDREDEEKKDRFAAGYERLKSALWAPIAAEMGIPWQEAEALYWTLGQDDIARRAKKSCPSEHNTSEDLLSIRSTDGDWHENRASKISSPLHNSVQPTFENYRTYHFNTTMAPKVQYRKFVNETTAGKLPHAATVGSKWVNGEVSSIHPAAVANLTTEGKRQAQAAGDILRARTAPSRYRKTPIISTDHTSHQNRWAEYKVPNTAFSPKTAKGVLGPALTSEGKRQAQAAGDKLRCRTNPIRHSRPSRSGSLEGVSKNRWSHYVSSRILRFDACPHAPAKPEESPPTKPSEADKADTQPSLLEVFEAELAKGTTPLKDSDDVAQTPDPDISAIPPDSAATSSKTSSKGSKSDSVGQMPQQPNAVLDTFKVISNHIQNLTGGSVEASPDLAKVIEDGIRTASGGFEGLMDGFNTTLQEISDRTREVADSAREVDDNGINETIHSLRNFVGTLAAGFIVSTESTLKSQPMTDRNEDSKGDSNIGIPSTLSASSVENNIATLPRKASPDRGADLSPPTEQDTLRDLKLPHQKCPQSMQDPWLNHDNFADEPQYHEPGPISLPQYETLSGSAHNNVTYAYPVGPGYVEHLRQNHTAAHLDGSVESRTASPSPAAARFPTLAQFEDQNFTSTMSFPALPSMEPLVPQRAASKTAEAAPDMEFEKYSGYASQHQSEQKSTNSSMTANHRHAGINLCTLSDRQSAPHQPQPSAVQADTLAGSTRNLATNVEAPQNQDHISTSPHGEHVGGLSEIVRRDYEHQLKLLEQQNKKRLLMARQEQQQYSERHFMALQERNRSLEQQRQEQQQNQERLLVAQQEQQQYQKRIPMAPQNPDQVSMSSHREQTGMQSKMAKQDYKLQLELLEQQNKRRLLMARQEQQQYQDQQQNQKGHLMALQEPDGISEREEFAKHSKAPDSAELSPPAKLSQEGQIRSKVSEYMSKERLTPMQQELHKTSYVQKLPGVSSSEQINNDRSITATPVLPSCQLGQANKQESLPNRPSSAARLAGPFDPLDVEHSAQLQLTEGVRRNATVAGTSNMHRILRRRPYSEAYDGFGRVSWNSFVGDNHDGDHPSLKLATDALAGKDESSGKALEHVESRSQQELLRSATVQKTARSLNPLINKFSNNHQDNAMKPKIDGCVKMLKDFGYDNGGEGSQDRLHVYAEAAKGDLVDAIEMIDEDQRAYREYY